MPNPSVGRVVHYVSYGTPGGEYTSQCRAAIVAGVLKGALPLADDEQVQAWNSDAVVLDLVVMNPSGLFFNRCPQDEGGTSDTPGAPTVKSYRGGTWHWPEIV